MDNLKVDEEAFKENQHDDFFVRQPEKRHWSKSLYFWKGVGAVFSGMCI